MTRSQRRHRKALPIPTDAAGAARRSGAIHNAHEFAGNAEPTALRQTMKQLPREEWADTVKHSPLLCSDGPARRRRSA